MTRRELVTSLSNPPSPQSQPCVEAARPAEALPPIPQWYGKTRIVLLVRDPNWLFTYWEVEPSLWQRAGLDAGAGSRRILRVYNTNGDFFDQDLNSDAQSWYLETGKPGQSFFVDIGLLACDGRFIAVARSNTVTAPAAEISPLVDEAWMTVEELYKMATGAPNVSSAELQKVVRQALSRQVSSGAVSSISSPVKIEAARGFWLVLNTELIVYGATEPDANVTIAGQKIPLNGRGEFSLRLALPDGSLSLPVVATSAAGTDEIALTPKVTKTTE
jgi:hypothetical protein